MLGLLIASAKNFYDTGNTEMTQLAADAVLLDRALVHYGPEAQEARNQLRSSVARLVNLDSATSVSAKTRLTQGRGTAHALRQDSGTVSRNRTSRT